MALARAGEGGEQEAHGEGVVHVTERIDEGGVPGGAETHTHTHRVSPPLRQEPVSPPLGAHTARSRSHHREKCLEHATRLCMIPFSGSIHSVVLLVYFSLVTH